MRKIGQVCYYSDSVNVEISELVSGSIFEGKYPMTSVQIQARPGPKFYLNNSIFPIIIGETGKYKIESYEINQLNFDAKSMNAIKANQNGYLIVDYIYEVFSE